MSLTFDNLIIVYLVYHYSDEIHIWGPLGFLDLGVSLSTLGKFSAIIVLNTLSVLFSFSSPSGIFIMQIMFLFIVSHKSLKLWSLILSSMWLSLLLKLSIQFFRQLLKFQLKNF